MTIPFVVPRAPELPAATWTAYLLTLAGAVPLVWRRRAPVAVLVGVLLATGLYGALADGPGQPLPYAGLVALYTVAVLSPPRRRLTTAAATAAVVVGSVLWRTGDARELLFSLFVFGAAYALGRLTDTRQAYLAAVEDRAAQLERANRIEAEQAAARERARIAREMHDVLSHAVSLMVVQAEAGPVAVRTAPERAEAAFDAISDAGRDAMVQLRSMLGVLREEPEGGADALPALVARVRESGLAVSYTAEGPVAALAPAVAATVHRVVQEALTNVVKHAGAGAVEIRLTVAETVTVRIVDDGRGRRGEGEGVRGRAGSGLGLVGVRERAAAHGGTVYAGPGPGGRGFEVRMELPGSTRSSSTRIGSTRNREADG
ncbi:histidine kinase [Streptomyces sp. NPDC047315]|uniref:sensor histidine kinase n=1 Tax=Streptomyces sp. NPDC047315 TaxID=3155142 RepID=UPI0033C50E95